MLKRFVVAAFGGALAGATCWYLGFSALQSLPDAIFVTGMGVGIGAVLGELIQNRKKQKA